jgi:hypothetical protein
MSDPPCFKPARRKVTVIVGVFELVTFARPQSAGIRPKCDGDGHQLGCCSTGRNSKHERRLRRRIGRKAALLLTR